MHVYLRKCSPGRNLLGIGNEILMGMQKPPSRKGSTQPNRKANRYRTFVALACAVLFSRSLLAATLTATLDRDAITLGERATLSLTFSGATPQSVPTPEVPGLQIDYVGQSSRPLLPYLSEGEPEVMRVQHEAAGSDARAEQEPMLLRALVADCIPGD